MIRFLLISIASIVLAFASSAQTTRTAASTSWADVNTALGLCVPGDTLQIPAGDSTWDRTLKVTIGITIDGAGEGVTIIRDGINKANGTNGVSDEAVFYFNVAEPQTARLTDLSILPATTPPTYANGILAFANSCKRYAIQRVTITAARLIVYTNISSASYGVFSKCNFTQTAHSHIFFWHHGGHYNRVNGNGAWESPLYAGQDQAWIVEECRLVSNWTSTININDGFAGARYVMRFNDASHKGFGHHGTESSSQYRAPRFAEIYGNKISRTISGSENEVFDSRDGGFYFWGNNITGAYDFFIKLNSYRAYNDFAPWGFADGTMNWDENDTGDSAGSAGPEGSGTGAADGVFDGGIVTSGSQQVLNCTGKTWTPNQWLWYSGRFGRTLTATSGTATTVTVAGAGWTTNQWFKYTFTRKDTNEKARIESNTSDTITFFSTAYRPNCTGFTGQFQLTKAGTILSNTSNSLNLDAFSASSSTPPALVPAAGDWFEIRLVNRYLDQTGRGQSIPPFANQSVTSLNHQSVGTSVEPSYIWLNNFKGNLYPDRTSWRRQIMRDRDFFIHITPAEFNGSSGIGSGTAAQMAAITPTLTNVGFWVTDQGSWNGSFTGTVAASALAFGDYAEIVSAGTTDWTLIGAPTNTVGTAFLVTAAGTGTGTAKPAQGQLYAWNGSAWALKYTPYSYPHPLRDDAVAPPPDETAPTLISQTINGATITLTFSEVVSGGTEGQWILSGKTLSSWAGSGSTRTMTVSPAATAGQSMTLTYSPGTVVDSASNALAAITGISVTNLTSAGDVTAPTVTGIVVNGSTATVTYSEPVTGVLAAAYSMSGGRTLSNPSGTGASRTFTVSPPAVFGGTYTFSYTAGTTTDLSSNALGNFSGMSSTNNTADPGPASVRNPGVRNKTVRTLVH